MSGRWRRGVITALATLGCCLLSAPAGHADVDDLLDTLLGSAVAGADQVDPGGVPIESADLGDLGVLSDPLAQLDQVLHGAAGQPGLGEPGSGPADTSPDTGTGSGGTTDHDSQSNTPGMPKLGMPSGGNGGGNGGNSGGSGGSPGNTAGKAKANAGATKDAVPPPPGPQPGAP